MKTQLKDFEPQQIAAPTRLVFGFFLEKCRVPDVSVSCLGPCLCKSGNILRRPVPLDKLRSPVRDDGVDVSSSYGGIGR